MRNLSIRLSADNQIELHVGMESRTGETTWVGLGAGQTESELGPAEGCRILFREWLSLLAELHDHQQVFLPWSFEDEQTRWLTVRRDGREASLVFGTAPREGWEVSVTDFRELAFNLCDFCPDVPLKVHTFYLPRLIANLRTSLSDL